MKCDPAGLFNLFEIIKKSVDLPQVILDNGKSTWKSCWRKGDRGNIRINAEGKTKGNPPEAGDFRDEHYVRGQISAGGWEFWRQTLGPGRNGLAMIFSC